MRPAALGRAEVDKEAMMGSLQAANGDPGPFAFSFASQLLALKVREDGRRVGRVRDLLARRGGLYPEVEGLLVRYKGRDMMLPFSSVASSALEPGGTVTVRSSDLVEPPLDREHFLVRDVLLDKQILDVQGAKIERVNDVHLLSVPGKTYVVHVDVGFTGLLRRLGVETGVRRLARLFGKELKDEMISWKHVQTFEEEAGPGPIRLAVDHARLKELHPGELADILEELNKDERVALLQTVDAETAANALEEVEPELGAAIVEDLDPEVAADILEEMEPSLATDLIKEVSEERKEVIKDKMEEQEWQELKLLETFEEKTAGALMTTEYLALTDQATVQDALDLIKRSADEVEIFHYVFLVDGQNRLTGTVGLRRLITSPPETAVRDIATSRIISVHPKDTLEKVADLFYKYNFLALPVVDAEGRLLGIIGYKHSFDQLVGYYYKEAS